MDLIIKNWIDRISWWQLDWSADPFLHTLLLWPNELSVWWNLYIAIAWLYAWWLILLHSMDHYIAFIRPQNHVRSMRNLQATGQTHHVDNRWTLPMWSIRTLSIVLLFQRRKPLSNVLSESDLSLTNVAFFPSIH